MKEIIDQYSPILEGVEVKELKSTIKDKTKKLRLKKLQHRRTPSQESDVSLPLPVKV